jgi:hypothetical protein
MTACGAPAVGLLSPALAVGGHDDADVVFATTVVPHHEQAVAMACRAADHTRRWRTSRRWPDRSTPSSCGR